MSRAILVLNAGSSSLKFGLYDAETQSEILSGQAERIGAGPRIALAGEVQETGLPTEAGHGAVLAWVIARLLAQGADLEIAAVGHRIVHGGREYGAPCVLGPEDMARLEALVPLAPAHQPHNLAGVRAAQAALPQAVQVGCFDTAFHRSQPRLAQIFAIPRELTAEGILRYGFHGLSYEHIAAQLPVIAGKNVERAVVLHLGHGASACALRNGRSHATSMGFTALDGLVMGKRCGSIDPGVLLHLMREKGYGPGTLEALLGGQSGLLGVSGLSSDMRDLLASEAPEAREAVDLFVYRAVGCVAEMAAALGGIDALVFTAGIGEHAAPVRQAILEGCSWLGFTPDAVRNAEHGPEITAEGSAKRAFVIPTDEEGVIARHAARLLG
ncbi:Acetate kinase [Pseudoruegeria aquimaris]|uniref:Acetate kinase n=1 Tax=Pseudoruegeria aquimaris TaxID=393663 RepID=A0A1Y5S8C5_9RHOB|nr:acetate/propionate family kinase [Pseudoruegeria aquimaris]SLN34737.1 Acetate kinase [Pseudoruegeria aquimaris]